MNVKAQGFTNLSRFNFKQQQTTKQPVQVIPVVVVPERIKLRPTDADLNLQRRPETILEMLQRQKALGLGNHWINTDHPLNK